MKHLKAIALIVLLSVVLVSVSLPHASANTQTLPAGTHVNYGDGTYFVLNKTLTFNSVQRVNGVLNFSGYSLALVAGWNFVSFPFIPADASFNTLFSGTYHQVWTWDGVKYVIATSALETQGYWVFVLNNMTLPLSGVPTDTYTSALAAGWNMKAGVLGSISMPSSVFPSSVLTWNGTAYVIPVSIDPAKGYWVFTPTVTAITVQ